jgi:predicted alpha-1,2-mannosidase
MRNDKKAGVTRRDVLRGFAAAGAVAALDAPGVFAKPDSSSMASQDEDLFQWVDIFLGTGGHGHLYPGASAPFGMVQLSPDTYNDGWDWCAGYHASDSSIQGFSHTHLSGTGCGDLLDFLLMPRTGEVRLDPGSRENPEKGYRSRFSHASEKAHPGYYSVVLDDTGIRAELTATERVGFHRYTFPASASSHFVLDLRHAFGTSPERVEWASIRQQGANSLAAGRATNVWARGRQIYAMFEFSRSFERVDFYLNGQRVDPASGEVRGKDVKAIVHFSTQAGEMIQVKAGLSGVDTEGALKNLNAEIPGWNFDEVSRQTGDYWRRELAKIQIETGNKEWKRTFYSSLYHSMLAPTLFDDADGRYRGMDGGIYTLPQGQHNYTTFSLWDTYRAEHPLMTLIHGKRVPDMINSLIRMAVQSPAGMPVWPLQGKETGTMTGYHSAAVIAEACVKGFKGIDLESAYQAMRKRAFVDDYRGLKWYRDLGYIPADKEPESVSKTLEYCYDDWAIAHVAQALRKTEDAEQLLKRSRNYRNYFDPRTEFLRAKLSDGKWAEPFDPIELGYSKKWRDYTESNSWQTTFGIQHDVTSYITFFGGEKAFLAKLDGLFNAPPTLPPDAPPDIAGLVGQYAHGNEPSHHIAYLYSFAGQPHKTQKMVRQLLTTMYSDTLGGIAGNEDCGQMSAWYILSAIGFYSVDPVSAKYIFGTPLFDKVTVHLSSGRDLIVEAHRDTPDSFYIDTVELNSKPHPESWFHHADVAQGGRFVLRLRKDPGSTFGESASDRPVSQLSPINT